MEMLLNCDIVIASEDAKFALPEAKRGVVAIQGGMCNLIYDSHENTSSITDALICRHFAVSAHSRASGTVTFHVHPTYLVSLSIMGCTPFLLTNVDAIMLSWPPRCYFWEGRLLLLMRISVSDCTF